MQLNKWTTDDLRFETYISNLKKEGVIVHQSLVPSFFSLDNGLEYPGLRVNQKVQGDTNLVLIPTKLLLTAHKALHQEKLQQVYQQRFYNQDQALQDRILIVYLLYIYSLNDDSIWCQMVRHFSRDIDIMPFWEDSELQKFQDKSIKNIAKVEKQCFQLQWDKFNEIREKYAILQSDVFNKENYKWIFIHTISRCFGSYMNSTYFTPFCQLFNHHCVDVSFNCVTSQQFQKQKKVRECKENKEQNKQSKEISNQNQRRNQEDDDQISSISSGYSVDYIEEGDFNYWQVETYQIKWGGKMSFDLKPKEEAVIENLYKEIKAWMNQHLVWSGFNLIFIGQIIEKVNIIQNEYKAGRKKFQESKTNLQKVKDILNNYKTEANKLYRRMGGKYSPKKKQKNKLQDLLISKQSKPQVEQVIDPYIKSTKPPKKDYVYFQMNNHKNSKFQKDQQIYFCYGRLSNRTMLIRYGCCILQNKYEHVWMKVNMCKAISPYPDLLECIEEKGLPIIYKCKIRPTTIPYQLYLWKKINKWQLTHHQLIDLFHVTTLKWERQIFEEIQIEMEDKRNQLAKYQNYQILSDKDIGYHEYFTRVYHLEKINILNKQIEIVKYLLEVFNQIQSEKKIPKVKSQYKTILNGYWKMLAALTFNS